MPLKIAVRGGHWIQTGPALGAGYSKQHHKHNHDLYVRPIGYHFAGNGRCVSNGPCGQAADPSNGAPTTNLGTSQGVSPSRRRTEERSC